MAAVQYLRVPVVDEGFRVQQLPGVHPGRPPCGHAVVVGAGAEIEFVVSCQIVRLLLSLLTATVVGGMMRGRHGPRVRSRRWWRGHGKVAEKDAS